MECSECGCIQITSPPTDLSKYYPSNYYSFAPKATKPVQLWLDRTRYHYALDGKGSFIGKLLVKKYGSPKFVAWVQRTGIKPEDAILDVGCGRGSLLQEMAKAGFHNLTGIDPYLDQDSLVSNGVQIHKKEIAEVSREYDLVMMHHSFEHMPEPLAILNQVNRILRKGSYALIRIPVVGYAWRKYGVNWVALDAPRHLFSHTVKSMTILANNAGFEVADIIYDSHAYQFWGSEQIARGIPVRSRRSYAENPQNSIFSREDIKSFSKQAEELNRNKDGDAACFYLYKK
ncbi:MAG: class I SAM-dependent methyltransferase [Moorea sp. SIO2B7]|nr:class I SAM-dependent methyltransferase [Moorena sp. SIO2B7]